jgi:hypothetical protein
MKRLFALVFAAGLCAVTASASGIGVFGSYWDTKDADGGYGGGAKFKMDVLPFISLEFRGLYFPDLAGDEDDVDFDLRVIPIEAAVVAGMPILLVDVYAGAGGGGYYMDGTYDSPSGSGDIDFKIQPGWFVEAGLQVTIFPDVALFAEVIQRWVDFEVDSISGDSGSDPGINFDSETGSLDGFGGNAGLLLKW